MGKFSGYLLATDADGTLFGKDGIISKRNIDAVKRFTDEGGLFIVATGRTADAARFIIEQMNVNAPCVLANGSQLYDFKSEEVVWERCLSEKELAAVESVFRSGKFPKCATEIHSGKKVYVFSPTPESEEHETREGLDAVICEDEKIGTIKNVFKGLITMRTEEEFPIIEDFVKSNAECELKIVHSTATFGEVKYHYFELLPLGITKAVPLEELGKRLGIKRENIFAIGDYYNDFEMLQFAGVSAVPEAAPDDLKKLADYVVCDCTLGAVGNFIELLFDKFDNIGKDVS